MVPLMRIFLCRRDSKRGGGGGTVLLCHVCVCVCVCIWIWIFGAKIGQKWVKNTFFEKLFWINWGGGVHKHEK